MTRGEILVKVSHKILTKGGVSHLRRELVVIILLSNIPYSGKIFHVFGAATLNALSPRVFFDLMPQPCIHQNIRMLGV